MGLKECEGVEIRSDVMGFDVTITQKIISKLFGVSSMGKCTLNTKKKVIKLMPSKQGCLS